MKNFALNLLGLLCLCLCFPAAGLAQDQLQAAAPGASVTGLLVDSVTAKPVEFATVALLQKDSAKPLSGTITGLDGSFTLTPVKPGEYTVSLSFIGYQTKAIPVVVTGQAKEVKLGTVKLSPETTSLKEVTVQTLRPTIVQEADKMVVSIEGTALAAGRTAYDVLATAPGVFVDHEGNIQLNGRSGVTVMVDGKLTYLSARDLRTMLEGMPAENLKNIEIITSPSARFDAQGSSGVLNINLKKNDRQGINGGIYSGYSFNGKQHGYWAGGNVNHKSGRWNSFLNLDFSRRVGGREATFTRRFQTETGTIFFDQFAEANYRVIGPPAVRLGTDFSLTEKHSIGVMGNYTTNKLHGDFLTDTYLGTAPNQPNRYIDAENYNTNRYSNFTGNLHYQGKFDTVGTVLSADLDYVKIANRGEANFYNYFYDLSAGNALTTDVLHTQTPNLFDIYSAKVDFTRPISKNHKVEAGAKTSLVSVDNDSRFYFNNGQGLVLDPGRTNHFIYDENIYAAYASWNGMLSERITLQAGLRAEQTISRGESLTTAQVTNRSYLDLFPSLFLQQKVTEKYSINYNYSHRINRPNYSQLNPFFSYRDPYTYWQGNPYLRPQYTHVLGITHVFNKTYNLVLNYQRNKDLIAELPAIDAATTTTVYYMGNVNSSQSLGLTAILPLKIRKNWDSNNTLIASYQEYSNIVSDKAVVNGQLFYMLQSNHNLLLPYNIKLEVNGVYQGPSVHALYVIEPRWWINTGLKRSFMKDKLDLSLNVNDIFKSQRLVLGAMLENGNVSDFNQYFRNRSLSINLRYKFSSGEKFDSRRQNNNLEELNRAR